MSVLEMSTRRNFTSSQSIINMNNQTVKELRAIAKDRGLKGYYKLLKAELVSLLKTPIRPPRRLGQRKPLREVTILPKLEDMDTFEKQEMMKNRSVVKTKLNEWYNWLVSYVPKPIKEPVSKTFSKVKSSIMKLYNDDKDKLGLKGEVEEQAEEDHDEKEQARDDFTPAEHKQAMNGSYKSFRVAGQNKADIDSYIALVTPEIRKLITEQVKVFNSAKMQMHMWVMWKKREEIAFRVDDDIDGKNATYEVKVEKPFNSRMTEVFQGSDIEKLLKDMFAYIKTQVEHPALPKSGFTIDYIMHLDIDFHRLVLTRGSSYIDLPEWIEQKKAVINPKNTDEECFKWAVIASLHHEEIGKNPQRITKLKLFKERYNWEGLKFPMAINEIGKFEKNNSEVAVNVLFTSKNEDDEEISALECLRYLFQEEKLKGGTFYIARRSDYNCKRKKQVNSLMIVDGENRHYTAVKNLSRLLSSSNCKTYKGAYHFCLNCLNGFRTESARDKHYDYCSSHGEVKVKMPAEKDKWLKFHDGQCQFKVPFMMHADFESILKPVYDRYKDNMKQMRSKRKSKDSYTEKINTHIPSGWSVLGKFAYGDVPDPMKTYRGKDCAVCGSHRKRGKAVIRGISAAAYDRTDSRAK